MPVLSIIRYDEIDKSDVLRASDGRYISAWREADMRRCMAARPARLGIDIRSFTAELAVACAMKKAGLPFAPPEYSRRADGKPIADKCFLSIAHTAHFACSAVSDKSIGVDAEAVRSVDPRLAAKILCRGELADYADSSCPNIFLITHWTAKESYLKLTGEGLAGGMRRLEYRGGNDIFDAALPKSFPIVLQYFNSDLEFAEPDSVEASLVVSSCGEGCRESDLCRFKSVNDALTYLESAGEQHSRNACASAPPF